MGSFSVISPGRRYLAVTPSDTVNLPAGCTGFFVGTTGNVVVVGDDDNAVTLIAPSVGTAHRLGVKRINSTSTTASNIVAIF